MQIINNKNKNKNNKVKHVLATVIRKITKKKKKKTTAEAITFELYIFLN